MVVVIEEAPEQNPTPLPEIAQLSVPVPGVEDDDEDANTSSFLNKDVSDGFETASDGEGGDEDGFEQTPEEQGEHEEKKSVGVAKDDSYQDALDDHELNQALALAVDVKAEGNELFKDGKYEDALVKYESALKMAPELPKPEPALQSAPENMKSDSSDQVASEFRKPPPQVVSEKSKHEPAQQLAPEMKALLDLRSSCHFNRAVCYFKLGKYDDTVKECSKAVELNPTYIKALHKRGEAYEKLERYEEAIKDMKKILELDGSDIQAKRNIVRLEPLAREKMEKMKEEMIGKLKDLGNNILGRFGMSVDNFKAVQDPKTGSYSVSFQR